MRSKQSNQKSDRFITVWPSLVEPSCRFVQTVPKSPEDPSVRVSDAIKSSQLSSRLVGHERNLKPSGFVTSFRFQSRDGRVSR